MTALLRFVVICLAGLVAAGASAQPRLGEATSAGPTAGLLAAGSGFTLEAITPPEGGLFLATAVVFTPDGTMYVTKKRGGVRVIRPDGTMPEARLVQLTGEVNEDGDRGLTGIALHPDFPATPYVYLLYPVDDFPAPRPASRQRGYSRLVRYTVDATGEAVVPGSRRVLIGATPETGIPSCYNSHSAGSLRFGHDGMLYLSHGEGASWAEPDGGGLYPECFGEGAVDPSQDLGAFRSQSLDSMGGKILRVDPETGLGLPDNPFWTGDGSDAASRVWALGLRNPFRFAVAPIDPDNPTRTELFVGDVGGGYYEEINRVRGGENYGWPCIEGPQPHLEYPFIQAPPGLGCDGAVAGTPTSPFAYFHHSDPASSAPSGLQGSSITGGVFYTGDAYPERYRGKLFFADYGQQWLAAARVGPNGLEDIEVVVPDAGYLVDLAVDPRSGELVAVNVITGQLFRLRHDGSASVRPVAAAEASARYVELGDVVAFDASGSQDPAGGALDYAWTFGDGTAAAGATVEHAYAEAGTFVATLTVTTAAGVSSQALVPVSVGVSLPELTIVEPSGYLVPETERVDLELTASDRRGEPLTTFWELDLVHNAHTHPAFARLDGAVGSVFAEPHAGPGEVAYYVARAVAVDAEGLRAEASRTLRTQDPAEVELGVPALYDDGAQVVAFAHAVAVGRVVVEGGVGDARVEVLAGGTWEPATYVHVLPEDDRTHVLLGRLRTRGVRLLGATLGARVRVVASVPPDADLPGDWTPGDAGAAAGGRAVPFGEGLALVGAGRFESGAYHTARRPLGVGEAVVVRLDALDGGEAAAAGVVAATGLAADAAAIALGRTAAGELRLWTARDGQRSERALDVPPEARWFRVQRRAGGLLAELSADSLRWTEAGRLELGAEVAVAAGPAVAGGDRAAVAWFDRVAFASDDAAPRPAGLFRVSSVSPNPGRGGATVVVEAGTARTVSLEIVDVRGRVVRALEPIALDGPGRVPVSFSRRGLAPGAYLLRVRDTSSGDTRTVRFVAVD